MQTNEETITKLTTTNTELKTAYENYSLKELTYEQVLQMDPTMTLYQVKMNYENLYETNAQLIYLLQMNNQALEETLIGLQGMQEKVQTLISTLTLYLGELESGAKQLSDGTTQLREGVALITEKTNELKEGTSTLSTGIDTLQSGIHEFNQEGISPITEFLDNDVREVSSKMEALLVLSEEYQTFTMKQEDTKGSTKFVSVIDSVSVPKEVKKVEKKEEKSTLWDRIINLFK